MAGREMAAAAGRGVAALALLDRELRVAPGPVPIGGTARDAADGGGGAGFAPSRDGFVLRISPELSFHYRRGAGVRYAAGAAIDEAAVATFHHGSVHGAVAWMNGFVPLHASAIMAEGQVHAFVGASGAGKSTLVAALGRRGLRRFADDVVVLDLASDGTVMALPGAKRMKLWGDALALTGLSGGKRVWPGIDKFYVEEAIDPMTVPLPLASVTVIDGDGGAAGMTVSPLRGGARFATLRDHCYRPDLRPAGREGAVFGQLAAIAAAVPVHRFIRPRDTARFWAGVDFIADHIRTGFA